MQSPESYYLKYLRALTWCRERKYNYIVGGRGSLKLT